jgi:hypothetical protein
MEAALASIESLDEEEHFTYTNVAKMYNVDRSTLSYDQLCIDQWNSDEKAAQVAMMRDLSTGTAPTASCSLVESAIRSMSSARSTLKPFYISSDHLVEYQSWTLKHIGGMRSMVHVPIGIEGQHFFVKPMTEP